MLFAHVDKCREPACDNLCPEVKKMCLAMPGKITKIEGDKATVSYPGQTREALIVDGDYSIGDYVFVSAQVVVQKLTEEEARKSLEAWEQVLENE